MAHLGDRLVKIQQKDLRILRDLHAAKDGSRTSIAFATIDIYIQWLEKDPNQSKYINFFFFERWFLGWDIHCHSEYELSIIVRKKLVCGSDFALSTNWSSCYLWKINLNQVLTFSFSNSNSSAESQFRYRIPLEFEWSKPLFYGNSIGGKNFRLFNEIAMKRWFRLVKFWNWSWIPKFKPGMCKITSLHLFISRNYRGDLYMGYIELWW